jgi:N-formylglutamate amidohydrolase
MISVKVISNVDGHSIYEAYKEVFETLEAKGYKPKMNVMDNQATKCIKKFHIKKGCNLQVVEPHNHSINVAERTIQTFKRCNGNAMATQW